MSDKAAELIELVQNEIAGLDSQFEFWITVTFAGQTKTATTGDTP